MAESVVESRLRDEESKTFLSQSQSKLTRSRRNTNHILEEEVAGGYQGIRAEDSQVAISRQLEIAIESKSGISLVELRSAAPLVLKSASQDQRTSAIAVQGIFSSAVSHAVIDEEKDQQRPMTSQNNTSKVGGLLKEVTAYIDPHETFSMQNNEKGVAIGASENRSNPSYVQSKKGSTKSIAQNFKIEEPCDQDAPLQENAMKEAYEVASSIQEDA